MGQHAGLYNKGYRDTLIWLSLLAYLKDQNVIGPVIFISHNKNDFYSGKKQQFHLDLQADIDTHSLRCNILPYNSLYEFVSEQALASHHEYTYSEFLEKYLNDREHEIEDELDLLLNHISVKDFKYLLESSNKSFPFLNTLNDYTFEIEEGIEDPEVLSYRKISSDIFYVNYKFFLRACGLNFIIPTSEYYINKEAIDRYYYNIESDDQDTSFYSYGKAYFTVSFNYSINTGVVHDLTLISSNFK